VIMSKETSEWLNRNTLIGFADQRGEAWHYRKADQGEESNHYPGAVPVEDIRRRLFNWEPVTSPVYAEVPKHDENGMGMERFEVPGKVAWIRPDTRAVMGIFTDGYQGHGYSEWLLTNVANMFDADLQCSSAGLLRGGAVAWVEVSMRETLSTPEGVDFRPNFLATTSFDGSIATTYKRTVTETVCDNTLSLALTEDSQGQMVKVRHSKYSKTRLSDMRETLHIEYEVMADAFSAQVKELCAVTFTDRDFERLLDIESPLPEVTPNTKQTAGEARALGRAEKRRDTLTNLWVRDPRVSPWHGTLFGAVQTFNTFAQHENTVRGGEVKRAERNMLAAIGGDIEKGDSRVYGNALKVLAMS
jgi:phage/plasmid-like protein (TIGR03299 family)